MTSFISLSRPVRLLGSLTALLSLTACPDEGIVDPFASGGTDGSSSGDPDDDGGPSPVTTAPPDESTTSGGEGTDDGPLDSTGGDSASTGEVEDSTTGMISGGSSTGDSMGESSSEGSSDGGIVPTLCPVDVIDTLPFSYSDSVAGEENEFGGSCGGGGAADHAYTLVAPEDGYYVFDTFGSSFDTVLYVLDGDCGGSGLACNDDAVGTQSEVSVQLTAGQTITIVVDSFGLMGGNYMLNGTFFGGSCPDGDIGSTVPQTVMGDTSDDGDNTTEGACGGGLAFDDSYTFTAPSDGVFVFDTEGSAFNTVLYAYAGDCNGAEIGCNDDIGGGNVQSRVYATMNTGEQVVLVVDGAGAASGAWQLNVGQHACPAEDLGNTAPQTSGGTTTGLPNVYDASCGGGGGPEIGLLFEAPVDGTYVIDTFGSGFDTSLSVLDGPACAGTELGCNDDTNGLQSQVVVDLAAGEQVSIMVDGFSATSSGNYTLNIGVIAGTCPDSDLGSTVPQTVNGDTSAGDNSGGATCGGLGGNDETWTFTAPNDGVFIFDTVGSVTDTILYVLDGDCNGASLGCNDDGGGGNASLLQLPLVSGQDVVVAVDGDGVGGAYTLNVSEDVCPDQDLGDTGVPFTTMGSTAGASNTLTPACGFSNSPDRALLWEAPAAGSYTFDTFGSGYDTILHVLDGATCGGASLACDDDTNGLQSEVVVNLAAGQQVVVVVDGFSGNSGNYTLNIN